METLVRKRWLFGMQLLGFLILDQIPLMMVSVVQFSTENFWFRFVSGLVAVGLGAYFVYLFVAFLKKKKLITWTFLGIKETLPVVLLGLVIIFCVGILGDFLLRLERLETTSNQQSVEEIVQAIPKGLILIFAGVIGPIFEEGIFRVGIQAFFKPASKIGILVSSILFALVHTPTDIGSFVIYWGMGLALSWVYLRTGRFEATVLTHFVWNVIGILML
ncbi:TPA: CPBP family intramembrane metalloprotease [Enterococcus faecalis]|nr:CPBP family intramembrane metalloprotease [Enterococcus faecalis]